MSSFRENKITCPACQKEGSYTVWDSINVDLDPNMKQKVMDGSLFIWVCPNCGKSFNVPYSFLYHDMTHKLMVQFDAENGHIIPFAEYIRISENKLNVKTIRIISEQYRRENPRKLLLFDHLTTDNLLVFKVLEMLDNTWEFTNKVYELPYDDYLFVCEESEKPMTDIWDEDLERISESEQIRYKIYGYYQEQKQKHGHGRISPEDIFGKNMSLDEYMEFLNFALTISGPRFLRTREEIDAAIAEQATNPDPDKMKLIAHAYMVGYNVEQSFEKSTMWFMKAAEKGDAEAMGRVGGAYYHGLGIEQDIAMAIAYYKKAIIAGGFADSLLDLGLAYLTGKGVPQNVKHGYDLMIRAAKQGNAAAQYNMGVIYRKGSGVAPNMQEALKWFNLSASNGYEQAVEFLNEYNKQSGSSE